MRVTNCTQNTIPKQSFGMKIKFHPDDYANGIIPEVDKMIAVLTNTNALKEVADLAPDTVTLKYKGLIRDPLERVFGIPKPVTFFWHMGIEKFTKVELAILEDANEQSMVETLADAAKQLADIVLSEQPQHAQEAARIAAIQEKIKAAGLV